VIALVFLNIALAVGWVFLAGNFTALSFLAGLIFGFLITSLFAVATDRPGYGKRLWRVVRFFGYFAKILVKANMQIAYEAITPKLYMTPRIVRYPVGHLSDAEKTTLANSITLTPGTLVVDISEDGEYIYVHCMYAKDRDEAVRGLDQLATNLHEGIFS
jgi:multicomponent Na+:H+ antiporter subunit E